MEKHEYEVLAAILQDNLGQRLTVGLGLGIIQQLGQSLPSPDPVPAPPAPPSK